MALATVAKGDDAALEGMFNDLVQKSSEMEGNYVLHEMVSVCASFHSLN